MFVISIILANIIDKMKRKLTLFLFLLSVSVPIQLLAQSQWNVMSHTDTDSGVQTRVATIENEEGYKLEIYRDANDVVRSRFSIRNRAGCTAFVGFRRPARTDRIMFPTSVAVS